VAVVLEKKTGCGAPLKLTLCIAGKLLTVTGSGVFVTLTGTTGGGNCAVVGLLVKKPISTVTRPNPRVMSMIFRNFFIGLSPSELYRVE
jgi:hypothetical protein